MHAWLGLMRRWDKTWKQQGLQDDHSQRIPHHPPKQVATTSAEPANAKPSIFRFLVIVLIDFAIKVVGLNSCICKYSLRRLLRRLLGLLRFFTFACLWRCIHERS